MLYAWWVLGGFDCLHLLGVWLVASSFGFEICLYYMICVCVCCFGVWVFLVVLYWFLFVFDGFWICNILVVASCGVFGCLVYFCVFFVFKGGFVVFGCLLCVVDSRFRFYFMVLKFAELCTLFCSVVVWLFCFWTLFLRFLEGWYNMVICVFRVCYFLFD